MKKSWIIPAFLCLILAACGKEISEASSPDASLSNADSAYDVLLTPSPEATANVQDIAVIHGDPVPIGIPSSAYPPVIIGSIEVSDPMPIDFSTPEPTALDALTGEAKAVFHKTEGLEEELLRSLTGAYSLHDIDLGGYKGDLILQIYNEGVPIGIDPPYTNGYDGKYDPGTYICSAFGVREVSQESARILLDVKKGRVGDWYEGGSDAVPYNSFSSLKWEYGPEDFVTGAKLPLLCVYFYDGTQPRFASTLEEALTCPIAYAFYLRVW